MKFGFSEKVNDTLRKFQEGGQMEPAPAPEEVPAAPELGGSPEEQLAMACLQALETQDCNIAMQVCLAILQMMGGGGEPAPAAPEGQEPVYRRGGRLVRYQRKF